jgi:hypothetical protein
MKTLIIAICLLGAFLLQGCGVYLEPVGGYYQRENFWYYRDGRGGEHREHGRYHHPEEHHDEHKR